MQSLRSFAIVVAFVVPLGATAAGCGLKCDESARCAVAGSGGDFEVCDGDDFKRCDEGTRGKVIACESSPRVAVCSLDGWTFQNAAK